MDDVVCVECVEPFDWDDVELNADDDFDIDDEFNEPDELDFEISDLLPADDDDEYDVLIEFEKKNLRKIAFTIWFSTFYSKSINNDLSIEKKLKYRNHESLNEDLTLIEVTVYFSIFKNKI